VVRGITDPQDGVNVSLVGTFRQVEGVTVSAAVQERPRHLIGDCLLDPALREHAAVLKSLGEQRHARRPHRQREISEDRNAFPVVGQLHGEHLGLQVAGHAADHAVGRQRQADRQHARVQVERIGSESALRRQRHSVRCLHLRLRQHGRGHDRERLVCVADHDVINVDAVSVTCRSFETQVIRFRRIGQREGALCPEVDGRGVSRQQRPRIFVGTLVVDAQLVLPHIELAHDVPEAELRQLCAGRENDSRRDQARHIRSGIRGHQAGAVGAAIGAGRIRCAVAIGPRQTVGHELLLPARLRALRLFEGLDQRHGQRRQDRQAKLIGVRLAAGGRDRHEKRRGPRFFRHAAQLAADTQGESRRQRVGDDLPLKGGGVAARQQGVSIGTPHAPVGQRRERGDFRGIHLKDKGHERTVRTERLRLDARGRAVPPARAGLGAVVEPVDVAGRRVTLIIQVARVAAVHIVLEVPEIIRLHQRAFIILVLSVVVPTLVITLALLVDVPDRDAGARNARIATGLLAVFEKIVLGIHTRLGKAVDAVEARLADRGGQRSFDIIAQGHLDGLGPARSIFEVGADLNGVVAVSA